MTTIAVYVVLGILVIGFAYAADQWHKLYQLTKAKLDYSLALNEALLEELDEDPRVVVLDREMSLN